VQRGHAGERGNRDTQDRLLRAACHHEDDGHHHHETHFEEQRQADDDRDERHQPGQAAWGGMFEDRRHEPVGRARIGHQRAQHRAERNDDADVA